MAFFVGNTSVYPGVIPTPNSATAGSQLFNDGTRAFWDYPGEAHSVVGYGWRYRTILTHGFHCGGYKGSNPWRSINKTWHQTDTTVYCGDQLDRAMAYNDGTFSDFNGYVHGGGDGFQGTTSWTSSYSLFNGTQRNQNSSVGQFFGSGGAPYGYMGNNPSTDGLTYGSGQASPTSTGGWLMSVARFWMGCASAPGGNGASPGGAGYMFGGGTAVVNKLHFPSEVMYTSNNMPASTGQCAAVGGQYNAWIYAAAGIWSMSWSNDTFTTWGFNGGTGDGACKSLMSKYGHFYAGPGGNNDTRKWKFNDATGAFLAAYTKISNFGEETHHMGQDWGYMLGSYNGNQTNWAVKTTYATDAQLTLGPNAQCKGHYGSSTGCGASAAMSIAAAQR